MSTGPRVARAVALEYGGRRAPAVTARGDAELAERILEAARRNGVHVTRDPQLLDLLARVEVGDEIPPELYTAVAVVLSWVYWLDGLKPGDERRRPSGSQASV